MIRRGKRRNALWSPRSEPAVDNRWNARRRRAAKARRRHDYVTATRLAFEATADAMNELRRHTARLRLITVQFSIAATADSTARDRTVLDELDEPYRLTPTHDI